MKAKVHIQWILSCPAGQETFLYGSFRVFLRRVLSIIKTSNLQNRRGLITPPKFIVYQ